MKAPNDLRAGVVGLGIIGGGVAASLVNSGRIPVVYDIIPDAYAKHPGVPAQVDSLAKLAQLSDIIMVAVFNADQAREVLVGKYGLLANAHEDMVIVLLSTVTVDEAKELSTLCAEKNVGFLDCGVTPGSLAAKNGLVAIVGGDKATFELARPVLADWAGGIVYCGGVGTGMAAKAARNVNTFGMWRVVTESARLAMAAGVDIKAYYDLLLECDKVENLFYNILRHKATTPDGKLPANVAEMYARFMTKDLKASIALSEALGVKMPVRDLVYNLINDTCDLE